MLKIDNISKTFNPGTVNEKKALSGLSLTVNDGDFISIIGANGAGKSTLFNAIAGTFLTDSGRITLDGEDITMTPEHIRARSIGRLFQDPLKGTAPDMSIEENLALAAGSGGWLSRITKKEKKAPVFGIIHYSTIMFMCCRLDLASKQNLKRERLAYDGESGEVYCRKSK